MADLRSTPRRIFARIAATLGLVAAFNASILTPAHANVGQDMQAYFDDAGGRANATGPSAFQGQSAGYYSGGNIWTRFPQKSIQPFNLQLPHARAGCGGIDLFAGSFSFINTAELVAMLKATANNAIGFAFQLAIEAISPQISGVIKDMSQKLQQINQMNISSCETAQGLVGGLWPKMETTRSTICEAVGNSQGLFSDWAASRQGCNNGDKRDQTIAANTNPEMKDQLIGEPHNFTWDILNKSPQFQGYDQQFKEMVMTIIGTVVTKPSPDKTKGTIIQKFGPGDDSIVEALLDGTQYQGVKVDILKCNDAECLDVGTQRLFIDTNQAIRPRVRAMLLDMVLHIQADTAITDAEKTLLNVASLPLYKILAVQVASRSSIVGTGEVDTLAELTAIDLLQSIMNDVLGKFDMAKVSLVKADENSAAAWAAQVQGVRAKFAQREIRNAQRVEVTMRVIDRTVQLESTLQNSMSPGMSAALNFSRGLNAQGLQ
ncbi:conjugal transfer protein TraH [Sphingomonas sp. SUN039]|uniref:conjugal transfer protein TraH n=1 Tax=Sphingomonas sp. SUN039 TaxID=2937787 RepID=UPI0021641CBC|nr:conjugal transfer protein TraH [Sphingomonas sp. SUN039]UVO53789.1 conjugal transfer protein TraH [Sphingomonas sp. SUN039]